MKAAVLTAKSPAFELLETLLWEGGKGFLLLDRHLDRLKKSAEYFGFSVDTNQIADSLAEESAAFDGADGESHRVRLLVDEKGVVSIESAQFVQPDEEKTWRVALAGEPVDSSDPFLYHKTTNRAVYDDAKSAMPGYDDVLLWNESKEVTESTVANVVIEKDGKLTTPPVKCGLLSGVFRGSLLDSGEIEEGIITTEDIRSAEKLFVINSVRKWIPCSFVT